jgi:integrase
MADQSDLLKRIEEANQQFEKLAIRVRGGQLHVRSRHFPPKPGKKQSKRTELSLDCRATIAGLKVAIAKAKEIDSQLVWQKFDWKPYLKGKDRPPELVKEWVERYCIQHWEKTQRNPTKENSFHKNYWLYFQKLPQDEPMDIDLLKRVITQQSEPGTRNREFYCMAFRKLAELANKEGAIASDDLNEFLSDLKELRRGYVAKPILPENLPTDEQIVEIWKSIDSPAWKWAYGVMACYGIRPSELFDLDLDRISAKVEELRVLDETKTGTRLTYPCLTWWRELFKPWEVVFPNIDTEGKSNNVLGEKITTAFRQLNIPHNPKALRHAWCIRTALKGIPDTVAAKWAGHSVQIHTKTYHQAISQAQHREVFERMKRLEELTEY